jgi:hypothetical protein
VLFSLNIIQQGFPGKLEKSNELAIANCFAQDEELAFESPFHHSRGKPKDSVRLWWSDWVFWWATRSAGVQFRIAVG